MRWYVRTIGAAFVTIAAVSHLWGSNRTDMKGNRHEVLSSSSADQIMRPFLMLSSTDAFDASFVIASSESVNALKVRILRPTSGTLQRNSKKPTLLLAEAVFSKNRQISFESMVVRKDVQPRRSTSVTLRARVAGELFIWMRTHKSHDNEYEVMLKKRSSKGSDYDIVIMSIPYVPDSMIRLSATVSDNNVKFKEEVEPLSVSASRPSGRIP